MSSTGIDTDAASATVAPPQSVQEENARRTDENVRNQSGNVVNSQLSSSFASEATNVACLTYRETSAVYEMFPAMEQWCAENNITLNGEMDIGAVQFNVNLSVERSTKGTYGNARKRLWEYLKLRGLYKSMLCLLKRPPRNSPIVSPYHLVEFIFYMNPEFAGKVIVDQRTNQPALDYTGTKTIVGRGGWSSPSAFKNLQSFLFKLSETLQMPTGQFMYAEDPHNLYNRDYGNPRYAVVFSNVFAMVKRDRLHKHIKNPREAFTPEIFNGMLDHSHSITTRIASSPVDKLRWAMNGTLMRFMGAMGLRPDDAEGQQTKHFEKRLTRMDENAERLKSIGCHMHGKCDDNVGAVTNRALDRDTYLQLFAQSKQYFDPVTAICIWINLLYHLGVNIFNPENFIFISQTLLTEIVDCNTNNPFGKITYEEPINDSDAPYDGIDQRMNKATFNDDIKEALAHSISPEDLENGTYGNLGGHSFRKWYLMAAVIMVRHFNCNQIVTLSSGS